MSDGTLTRRKMLVASATAGSTMLAASLANAASPASSQTATAQTSFSGAVMHVPVIVPPNADALADVRARNAAAMVDAIEGMMKGPGPKPRLLVFPVLQFVSARRAVSGVPMSAVAVDLTSAPLDQGIFAPIVAACRRHNCYVSTSTQEFTPRLPGRFFHTGFIMGPDGLVLRSPKSQARSAPEVSYLRDMVQEYTDAFGPGSILPVVKTPIGTLGCYIEAEAAVFEAARLLSSKGAQIICHPSLEDDMAPWLALKQSIAYQCQVFLLTGATSRNIGPNEPNGGWCGGAATIIGPDGSVLGSLSGHDEGGAAQSIDLGAIEAAKMKNASRTTPAWTLYRKFYADQTD